MGRRGMCIRRNRYMNEMLRDKSKKQAEEETSWDDHSKWKESKEDSWLQDVWVKRFEDACEAIRVRDPS